MRFLLIVLLLANLVLYLYVRDNEVTPVTPPPPIAADKIVLLKTLAENEPVPAASPTATAEPVTPCLEWGPLADTQLDNARAALGHIAEIETYQEIRRQGPTRSWLVSLDGFDNRTTAVNRANELRRQGISDISVMESEPGSVPTFSLSLGVFSSEQGAQARVAALNDRKISNVNVAPRPGIPLVFFVIPNTSPALEQHLRELPDRFADSAVQGIACPPSQTP